MFATLPRRGAGTTNPGMLTQRSMRVTSRLASADPSVPGWNGHDDLWNERSLQINSVVYQRSGGQTLCEWPTDLVMEFFKNDSCQRFAEKRWQPFLLET